MMRQAELRRRLLIVNADDFGMSAGINRGIAEAHERGIVTSTSLMVRWPAAKDAAVYARARPALGVGLHLDLGEWMYRDGQWFALYRVVAEDDAAAVEEVFSDGLLNVMEAPEFAQSDKLRQVFSALENRAYLGELVGSVAGSGRIRIVIGAENPREEMHDVSLILAPYGRLGRAIGVVGVLGPTRMSYPNAIGTVSFVSGLMNELVDHLYA